MSLMCLIAYGVWRWRKSRKQAILAMYYNAVSKSKTKLPPFPISKRPTVPPPAASAEHPDATGFKHLERPPHPVSADSPAGSRPNVWKAVNRHKSLAPLPSTALTPIEQPPLPTVDQRSGAGSRDKSLLASAIRSKMLRQSPSIRKSRHERSSDQITVGTLSSTSESVFSEASVRTPEPSVNSQLSVEPDEIELQLSDAGGAVAQQDVNSYSSEVWDGEEPIAEVESFISEDSTAWRAREYTGAMNVDEESTVGAASVGVSVFSTMTAVESQVTSADREQTSVFSRESSDDDSQS
jgi:hypothetical protein